MELAEPGPVGCEWEDVLNIRTQSWKDKSGTWRSRTLIDKKPGVTYVTVSLVTGEICDFEPRKRTDENGQYSLIN